MTASPRRSLRVAIVCPYSLTLFGGVQGQVLGLAGRLRQIGVDARVIGPTDGPPPEPGITSVGPTVRFPTNGSIAPINSSKAVATRTLEALRAFGPDVLHLHEPLTPGPNHAALVGTDLPAVGTFHAAHPGRNAWYDALRLPLRRMVDRLTVRTAVSEEAQRNVEAAFGGRCEILPNAVDADAFATAPPWLSERPAILFVGRHEPRKGLAVLLEAFAGLEHDAVLWVAGEGPASGALRALGTPRVEWLGRISEDDKASRLAGAAVACFPSLDGESFGVVLLEAMAAGSTIVASDLTGYRTVARPDVEALLVPPGDPAALRAALRRGLADRELASALSEAGRARAAEFSFVRLGERVLDVYETAVRSRRAV